MVRYIWVGGEGGGILNESGYEECVVPEMGQAEDILNAFSSVVNRLCGISQSVACDWLLRNDDILEENGEDLLTEDV